ncbi:MAG: hypothetical protein VB119_06920 [Candidatus Metalachnospira sp.]|nr:hypothetical protein [Candidatus Metalachnospira sp.]
MSVQSEISRLGTAKTSIKSSIANKGITVPEGTKLESMSGYIDQIETGDIPDYTFSIYNGGLRITYKGV